MNLKEVANIPVNTKLYMRLINSEQFFMKCSRYLQFTKNCSILIL